MPDEPCIGDVGEHALLERLCARLRTRFPGAGGGFEASRASPGESVLVGPGDDCAIVVPGGRPLALTIDALVEGVHFRQGWLSPGEIGARAVAASLSDLAAVGARPLWSLAAVTAPVSLAAGAFDELLDGCAAASADAGAALVGGNLARADVLSVTTTAIGAIEGPYLTRSGALPGDMLLVTGSLGASAAAVAAWLSGTMPSPPLRDRFARPAARIAAGQALATAGARAAIDVSDGLLTDLGHLCRASNVGALVERDRLPRLPEVAALDDAGRDFAATGGEDYELLAACPPELALKLDELAAACGVPLTVVGRCTTAREGIRLVGRDGAVHRVARGGFDHFAPRRSAASDGSGGA